MELKMISLQPFRRFFLTISLSLLLVSSIFLSLGTENSWAATSFTQSISQPQLQIATMSQAEIMGKNKQGNSPEAKNAKAKKATEFKAQTLEGMNNSIVSPDYQPGGKTKQAGKQDSEATADIKAEAREAMN
jgi:hypothetical protein